jgi:hypothetical protein
MDDSGADWGREYQRASHMLEDFIPEELQYRDGDGSDWPAAILAGCALFGFLVLMGWIIVKFAG